MTNTERQALREFIGSRQDIALNRLVDNTQYQEMCQRQGKTSADADNALEKLEKEDRITIRRHYEGEMERTSFELDEVYLQGLRDSVKILALLGVFGMDIA